MEYRSRAILNSTQKVEDIMVLEKVGANDFIVRTEGGVVCKATFNFFNRVYYADDIHGIIQPKKEI
jgi:hypothetical protein